MSSNTPKIESIKILDDTYSSGTRKVSVKHQGQKEFVTVEDENLAILLIGMVAIGKDEFQRRQTALLNGEKYW